VQLVLAGKSQSRTETVNYFGGSRQAVKAQRNRNSCQEPDQLPLLSRLGPPGLRLANTPSLYTWLHSTNVCRSSHLLDQEQQTAPMAEKKQPVFKQVADLRPGTHGHNLHVKVCISAGEDMVHSCPTPPVPTPVDLLN